MNNLTEKTFEPSHFNAFTQIDNVKRYGMMSVISTFTLAMACCHINDVKHLKDIIIFMTLEQQQAFKSLIKSIQAVPPSAKFVVEIQQMIIQIFERYCATISALAMVGDMIEFNFGKGLNELPADNVEPEFSCEPKQQFASVFSLLKLKAEMKHRKPKDMPKLKELLEIGPQKKLYYANKESIAALSPLAKSFPNFKSVINQINAACQVSLLTKSPLSLPVINLQGHPGIGKTQFINALATTLQREFFSINAAAMTGRFELSGGNPQYGDADLGAIGRIMCFEAKSFQPVILVDELCMAKDNQNESIIQPLYSFFDREQRKCFKENFLNLELDVSGAIIFTTTNDYEALKPALKSRLVNIEIEPPTPIQMQAITQKMYQHCLADMKLKHYFDSKLSAMLLSTLDNIPPRAVIEKLRQAIGQACTRTEKTKRIELTLDDFEGLDIYHDVENSSNLH